MTFTDKVQELVKASGAKVVPFSESKAYEVYISPWDRVVLGGQYVARVDRIFINFEIPLTTEEAAAESNITMLHELGHWTGHSSRQNRIAMTLTELEGGMENVTRTQYATEEATAETIAYKLAIALGFDQEKAALFRDKYLKRFFDADMERVERDSNAACEYLLNLLNSGQEKLTA